MCMFYQSIVKLSRKVNIVIGIILLLISGYNYRILKSYELQMNFALTLGV